MRSTIKKVGQGGARRVGDFKRGFAAPIRGIAYLARNPGTLKFALPPIPIIFALLASAIYASVGYSDDLLASLWSQPVGEAWYVTWLLGPLWLVAWGLVMLVLGAVGVVLVALLGIPLAGPFMELLSEKVEAIETGFEAPFDWGVMLRNIGITLIHVLIFTTMGLLVTGVGFGLGFIPVAGQALALAVSFTIVPVMLAFTPLDYPMTIRLWPFGDKMRFVWRNLSLVYGFSLATYLFLYVPILNLFLLPACVVASTRLLIELQEEGRIAFRDRRKEVLVARARIEPDGVEVAAAPPGGAGEVAAAPPGGAGEGALDSAGSDAVAVAEIEVGAGEPSGEADEIAQEPGARATDAEIAAEAGEIGQELGARATVAEIAAEANEIAQGLGARAAGAEIATGPGEPTGEGAEALADAEGVEITQESTARA